MSFRLKPGYIHRVAIEVKNNLDKVPDYELVALSLAISAHFQEKYPSGDTELDKEFADVFNGWEDIQ